MTAKTSARIAALLIFGVVLFQLSAVAGAPVGAYTQGGQHTGALDSNGRVVAFISAFLLSAMAGSVLARVGEGPLRNMSEGNIRNLSNLTAIYLALSVYLNLITKSSQERQVFWPLSVVMFMMVFNTLLKTPKK